MVGETKKELESAMYQRVLIEFVVEIPNEGVARDVQTRIAREHTARLGDVFQSVTGYLPQRKPNTPGFYCAAEIVTWNEAEAAWIGPDDGDDDEPNDADDDE